METRPPYPTSSINVKVLMLLNPSLAAEQTQCKDTLRKFKLNILKYLWAQTLFKIKKIKFH